MLKFWKSGETAKVTAKPAQRKKTQSPEEFDPFLLLPLAVFLSACSMVWTAFSVTDLLGIALMGLTVAITLDLIWLAVMYATHKEIPFYGSLRATQVIGWVFLIAVMVSLSWHGVSLEGKEILGYTVSENASRAMAIIGPILPLGSKVVWVLISSGYKKAQEQTVNPEGYTQDQLDKLEEMERASKFEEAEAEKELEAARRKHRQELEEIRMGGEKVRARNDVNFDVERARIEQTVKLRNEMPVDLVRIIQGEVQQPMLPAQSAPPMLAPVRSIPAESAKTRSEVTMSITDLNDTQRKNMQLAVKFLMLKEKDPAYTQNQFAADNGVTSGTMSKIMRAYRDAVDNGTLSVSTDEGEAATG